MSTKISERISFLLVDDNLAHAELIMRSMEDNPIVKKIHHVTDGVQALDYVFQRNQFSDPEKCPRPQVILLDLRIPKIDGLEVLQEIKVSDQLRDIPVVILTTSSAVQDVTTAYKHHANSYLVKPLGFEKFAKMMNDIVDYWLVCNHQLELES